MPDVWSPGVGRLSWTGWNNGRKIAKEGEREAGQGSGLPDAALQLALGVELLLWGWGFSGRGSQQDYK